MGGKSGVAGSGGDAEIADSRKDTGEPVQASWRPEHLHHPVLVSSLSRGLTIRRYNLTNLPIGSSSPKVPCSMGSSSPLRVAGRPDVLSFSLRFVTATA